MNGWENYETWNVALWIGNDEGLYNLALDCDSYQTFVDLMRELGVKGTPDGVAYDNPSLCISELNDMIREL